MTAANPNIESKTDMKTLDKTGMSNYLRIEAEVKAREANKAQHSPLPWHIGMKPGPIIYGQQGEQIASLHVAMVDQDENKANARLIVASVNHADKLAEALRDVTTAAEIVDGCETPDKSDIEHMLDCFEKAHKTLAAYEAAQ